MRSPSKRTPRRCTENAEFCDTAAASGKGSEKDSGAANAPRRSRSKIARRLRLASQLGVASTMFNSTRPPIHRSAGTTGNRIDGRYPIQREPEDGRY